jgi:hypothetical protein
MSRRLVYIAEVILFSAVLGWGQTAPQSTPIPPVNGPFGGPILVTPSAGFPNPTPAAGISDAGRAGISNSTNETELTTAPPSPAMIVTSPSIVSLPESTRQTQANDSETFSPVSGAADASAPSTVGVAEAASRFKAEKGARNARVLDNEDVQGMINHKNGVTTAKNMPPLGSEIIDQGHTSAEASAPPAATQPVQQDTQTNVGAAPAGQKSASTQTATASSAQSQIGTSETDAENSTTPQINSNQQSNDAQGSRRLPATATFLPLLGLLGLLSGGIGFWYRKFRN